MRYGRMPAAAVRSDDDPKMIDAILALASAGVDVRRPPDSNHQLKVSPSINFYPGRGTIVVDGEPAARRQRGLASLIELLTAGPERDAN